MTVKATLTAAFPEARRISNFLERDWGEAGAVVSLDERPDGLWSVDAYFEAGEPAEIAEKLRDRLGADAFGALTGVATLPETDWVAAGLQALQPVFAGRFVVHGSHDRGKIPAGRVAIEIDAGQAFGTGHHGTTAGCLTVLDRLTRSRRFENPLDLGTGSGVLAIALAKILRRPVLATDIDPLAVRIAAENARDQLRWTSRAHRDGGRHETPGDPRARTLRPDRRQHPRRAAPSGSRRSLRRFWRPAARSSSPACCRTSASASWPPMARKACG